MFKSFAELKKRHKASGGDFFDLGAQVEGNYIVQNTLRKGRFFIVSTPNVHLQRGAPVAIAEHYSCFIALDSGDVYPLHAESSSAANLRQWADGQPDNMAEALKALLDIRTFHQLEVFRMQAMTQGAYLYFEGRMEKYAAASPSLTALLNLPECGAGWVLG